MRIRLALVSFACLGAMASTAAAQPDRVPTRVSVPDMDVDFSRPDSTALFYGALKRAAADACDSRRSSLAVRAQDRACAADALDQVVQQMARPTLGALHAQATGRPAPLTQLAAQ